MANQLNCSQRQITSMESESLIELLWYAARFKRVDLPAPTKPPVNAQRQTTSLVNLLEEVSYLANSPEDDDNVLRRAPSSLSRQ